jgi:hypothetical protein
MLHKALIAVCGMFSVLMAASLFPNPEVRDVDYFIYNRDRDGTSLKRYNEKIGSCNRKNLGAVKGLQECS